MKTRVNISEGTKIIVTYRRFNKSKVMKNNYTLALDWVQFTAHGVIPTFTDGYHQQNEDIVLRIKNYKTRFYNKIADVIYKGQEVAEIEWSPHSPILNPISCMVKLKNEVCYESKISEVVRNLLDSFGLKFNNWTRLDFALDGFDLLTPLKSAAITAIDPTNPAAEIRLVGKSDIKVHTTHNGITKGIYVGGMGSNKSLCGYVKGEELKKSRKSYISDFWSKNGIDESRHDKVERLEIRCKNEELKQYDLFDPQLNSDPVAVLDALYNIPELFEDLYKSLAKKLYEFIDINAQRSNTAARLFCLRLKKAGKQLVTKTARLASSELQRMKQAAKTLHWVARATGRKFYTRISEDISRMIDHEKWRIEKRLEWDKEYRLRDGDRRFQFLSYLTDNPSYEQLKLYDLFIPEGKNNQI